MRPRARHTAVHDMWCVEPRRAASTSSSIVNIRVVVPRLCRCRRRRFIHTFGLAERSPPTPHSHTKFAHKQRTRARFCRRHSRHTHLDIMSSDAIFAIANAKTTKTTTECKNGAVAYTRLFMRKVRTHCGTYGLDAPHSRHTYMCTCVYMSLLLLTHPSRN